MKIVFGILCLLASGVGAQQLQIDPGKSFSLVIPGSMLPCVLNTGLLSCPSDNPVLTVNVSTVPAGSSTELMALNSEDSVREKPNFRMLKKETIMIDGNKAIIQTMTFNNLGNVTLPVVIRVVDAVLDTKAFELEMACNQSNCPNLLESFDDVLKSLHLAKPGQVLKQSQGSSLGGFNNWMQGFKF